MQLKLEKNKRQQLADRECPISKNISISHFNSPSIFETKQGVQGFIFQVQGCAFEVTNIDILNRNQKLISNLLLSLSDEFAVYVTSYRRQHNIYPGGDFKPGFADQFNIAYQKTFASKPLFINEQYITVLIKGPTHKVGKGLSWFKQLSNQTVKGSLEIFREKQQKKLKKIQAQVLESLKEFTPKPLVESELLSFFSILINGEKRNFIVPQQDLAVFLPTKRLFIGHNTIEWQGNTKDDRKLAAILSVKQYPSHSSSFLLDSLLKVNFEYISTHSFVRQDQAKTLEVIKKQNKHFADVEDAALSQQDALVEAMDLLASNSLAFGFHHNTLMVFGDSQDDLDQYIAALTKLYRDADLVLIRESLNCESAFWAQIPGNFKYIKRKSLISSDNFADFCPLHNYHHGYIDQNHLGSALMLVESSHCTPLYLNFHEKSSGKANDLSKGHTTLIAPSNAGKTTLMLALDAQSKKYASSSFFFDRDRGCEIYIRAMNGKYFHIHPNEATKFNPLHLEDTPKNRDFLIKWLSSLLVTSEENLTAEIDQQVESVIYRSFTLPFENRNLSVISSFFPANFSKFDSLLPWLKSTDPNRPDGRLAYLFDHDYDELSLNQNIAGFDMTHLLDHEAPNVVFSVMLYLFHRIDSVMNGRLIGIYLDEGWQLLNNAYWTQKMRQYLATLRKLNVYLVFATQSPSTVATSPLRSSLIEGSATNIFLPNPKAEIKDYCDGFKLSNREFEFIKTNTDRKFLIKQGHDAAIGKLNLNGLDDYLAVFSANKTTVSLLDEIRKEVGDDPEVWLPIFQQRRSK